MLTIIKKELKSYFTSIFSYLYYMLFFFMTGLLFVTTCLKTYSTDFGYYVLSSSFAIVLAFLPICTMRLFAQEKKERTDQILFTSPISEISILLGKYISAAIFTLLPVLLSLGYPLYISFNGTVSVKFLACSYIAVLLVALVCLSIGTFMSAISSNPIIAAVFTYAVYVLILLVRMLEIATSENSISKILREISIYDKYSDMTSGIVRSGDILYLIFLSIGLLVMTLFIIMSRRKTKRHTFFGIVSTVIIMVIISFLTLDNSKVFDFTSENLLTLSDDTEKIVEEIECPVTIYYMGKELYANATYRELLNAYAKLNDNISIEYIDYENNAEFAQQYLNDVFDMNSASLLVASYDKYIYLDSNDYISVNRITGYTYSYILEIENQITSAISYVCGGESSLICTISGHDESQLSGRFYNMCLLNGYEFKDINVEDAVKSVESTFPERCKMVFIDSPQSDYTKEALSILGNYLKNGGKIFITLDPLNEELPNLYNFLSEYGIEIKNGVVIEQDESGYVEGKPYYLAPAMKDTVFTNDMIKNNMQVLSMTSKGIVKIDNNKGYGFEKVLTTGKKSFSKIDDFDNIKSKGENDISGPFSVAAYADNPEAGSLFVLTSDVFFQDEVDVNSSGANRRFVLNVLDNMTDSSRSVMVKGKNVGNQTALYPVSSITFVKILTIAVIPCIILLAGILVILIRNDKIKIKK